MHAWLSLDRHNQLDLLPFYRNFFKTNNKSSAVVNMYKIITRSNEPHKGVKSIRV
jgi:hypothetical protein